MPTTASTLAEPQGAAAIAPRWWREWEAAAIVLLVAASYLPGLGAVPVCGEESRWATAAREMIAGGDWIVPRQQGTIFPERPPLGSWMMALTGLALGQVDLLAVRLPSVLAVLLLSLLIYAYCRPWMSRLGSFAAAAIFATFGQVLQLGRLGESEAVFTFLVAGSLFVWHWGYTHALPDWLTWSGAYALAGLGTLVKGPQAPVYLLATTAAFLACQRNWKRLFGAAHLEGIACFGVVVGVWLVPFALAYPRAVDDIFIGLAQDRFTLAGLAAHVASFPFETFGCLLPWSGLLVVLANRSVGRAILRERPQVLFPLVALAVTYPTVWFAAGARGRYFMPLYPCLAVLIAVVFERCASPQATHFERLAWRRFQRVLAAVLVASAGVFGVATTGIVHALDSVRQPPAFLALWVVAALAAGGVLAWTSLGEQGSRPRIAMLTLAAMLGFVYAGPIVNSRVLRGNDLTSSIARIKGSSPRTGRWSASIGFTTASSIPTAGRSDRCRGPSRPPTCRPTSPISASIAGLTTRTNSASGDGRESWLTPGTLPFAWEKVAEIPCDPQHRGVVDRSIVIGRVQRPEQVAQPPLNPTAFR